MGNAGAVIAKGFVGLSLGHWGIKSLVICLFFLNQEIPQSGKSWFRQNNPINLIQPNQLLTQSYFLAFLLS